jgi:ribosomal protein S18 acetylase RimI-like enzyme
MGRDSQSDIDLDSTGRQVHVNPVLRPYRPGDREALMSLWSVCELTRPWNNPSRDIERKLARDAENLLVLEQQGRLIGSVMVGYEGHRGWINYLAVHPDHRRQGLGRLLMDEAERRLHDLGCPKVNLQVRNSNGAAREFYRQIGYAVDEAVSFGKRLEHDAPPPS